MSDSDVEMSEQPVPQAPQEAQEARDQQERKQARREKRAKRLQEGAPAQGRQRARLKRRAERAREVVGRTRPAGPKPGKAASGGRGVKAKKNKPEKSMQMFVDTMVIARGNDARRHFPDRLNVNCRDGALFPDFEPKFKLDLGPTGSVFTIGSGFSRDLEPALQARGVTVPPASIIVPEPEIGRPENPLNEYTPASIAQRLSGALGGARVSEASIIPAGQLFSDQLLPGQLTDTMPAIEARRQEIADIYARLRECSAVIITLASAEVWYDAKSKSFFNRPPPEPIVRRRSRHLHFAVQDSADVVAALTPPLAALGELGIKVVLVVSPVAQRSTFSAADAVTANETSKSVLRAAVHRLTRTFSHVDYFPAYEIVRSAGLHAYLDDNVQLRGEFAALLVAAFISAYAAAL